MIKMIVTDLDGTLLRQDKTVSEYTASVFRRCADIGVRIVFATARPIRAVKMLELGIRCDACVCHNGAVVTVGERIFRETGIGHAAAKALLNAAGRLSGMRIAVEINDALYANFDASTIWPGILYTATDFGDLPELPVDKIIFVTASRDEISRIERLLGDSLYWEISENTILMVMSKGARKRNAVQALAAQYGLSFHEIAAFGDDHNDVEMLQACGAGVAVANAIDEVKAVAGFICPCNDEDGVATWIEENVL